jgi:small-conductance mechanosensitive channel
LDRRLGSGNPCDPVCGRAVNFNCVHRYDPQKRRNFAIHAGACNQVLASAALWLCLFIGMRTVGLDLAGLAVLSGAIGVGLGFDLQKMVSNLVSGIIILLDKSIKPGDVISLG